MAPKSFIWKFFHKISKEQARCNICSRILKTSGNTTNLKSHLVQKHNYAYRQYCAVPDTKMAEEETKTPGKKPKMSSPATQVPKHKDNTNFPSSSSTTSALSVRSEQWERNELEEQSTSINFKLSSKTSNSDNGSISTSTHTKSWPISYKENIYAGTVTRDLRQPTINQAMHQVTSFSEGGSKNVKITDVIVNFIIKDNLRFTTVEGAGFLSLMKEVAPLYKVPTRNCIKEKVDKKYDLLSEAFKKELQNIKYFTITTDIWTADMQTKSFMGITIHFSKNQEICSATLGITELTESHTSAYIITQLQYVFNQWNIDIDRIVAAVTDNGANMVKACQDFLGKTKHVPCFAHTINLVCEHSIKNTENLQTFIEKVRAIVVWFKRSVHASDQLRKAQKNTGIPEGNILKPILDVKTRWNSTYYMLERFLKLAPLIGNIVLSDINAPNMVNASELEDLKQVCQLLVPLEQTTKEMSGQDYVTLSKVIPMIMCLTTQYENFIIHSDIAGKLKVAILKELSKRFGSIEKCFLPAAATILDPRFKNIHFKDPIALSTLIRHLKNELIIAVGEESSSSSDISEQADMSAEQTFDLWAPHKNIAHTKKSKNIMGEKSDELTQYLSVPVRHLKENPLEIWDEMRLIYPNLYKLAQKFLVIVATSVPSERLFSKAGAIATKNRSRLTGKRLSKLLFLASFSEN